MRLAAVEAGASAIGFNFYRESPRYISPTGAAMIAEKIPVDVWKVGVFVNEIAGNDREDRAATRGSTSRSLHGTSEARGDSHLAGVAGRYESLALIRCSTNVEALLIDSPV